MIPIINQCACNVVLKLRRQPNEIPYSTDPDLSMHSHFSSSHLDRQKEQKERQANLKVLNKLTAKKANITEKIPNSEESSWLHAARHVEEQSVTQPIDTNHLQSSLSHTNQQ
jgi:hypothetical protein